MPKHYVYVLRSLADRQFYGQQFAAVTGPKLFFSMANHFPGHRAAIETGQIFFHCRCEQ
jgi:hypothetical protein